MKKHVFTRSIQILIVALLLSLAVFRNQWIAIAVTSAWLLFVAGWLLFKNRRQLARWSSRRIPQHQPQVDEQKEMSMKSMINIPNVSDPPAMVLLRHLNCRISDKLKSAYPNTTWSWLEEQPELIAMKGGTGRIKLDLAGEFTHAEVTVDQLARIDFKMMKLVDINALLPCTQPATGVSAAVTTDASAWFDLVGREQLTA